MANLGVGVCRLTSFNLKHLAAVAKNSVELLGDPDEGGPAAQLLQFACPNIGAGGADATQDVSYGDLHRALVGNFNRLPLGRSGDRHRGDSMNMLRRHQSPLNCRHL